MLSIDQYNAKSGRFVPVYTLEIQTLPKYTDKLLDAVIEVYPLMYGRYERNASISAVGIETARPQCDSTTSNHIEGFEVGMTETYPMVEIKITLERDLQLLQKVMDAILYNHHYEEPAVFLREDWVSRSSYDPHSDNPNRWWNNGQGLPPKID